MSREPLGETGGASLSFPFPFFFLSFFFFFIFSTHHFFFLILIFTKIVVRQERGENTQNGKRTAKKKTFFWLCSYSFLFQVFLYSQINKIKTQKCSFLNKRVTSKIGYQFKIRRQQKGDFCLFLSGQLN